MPLASVVLTAHNSAPFIRQAINSVLRQTFRDFELIVVDDGSTDGTREAIEAGPRDGRIRVIHQAKAGPAAALNTGLRAATGVYVALLDGDDMYAPEKLRLHVECFERHPGAGLTFSWSDWVDIDGNKTGLHSRHCRGVFGFDDLLKDFLMGNTSSTMLRHSAIERVGVCDPRFSFYYDADLFYRVLLLPGACAAAVPHPLTLYRRHPRQMSRNWHAMRQEWQALLTKLHTIAPAQTRSGFARATSNMERYFAYVAYEAGSYGEAAAVLAASLVRSPVLFTTDVRNWVLGAAVCSGILLPGRWHASLEMAARRLTAG